VASPTPCAVYIHVPFCTRRCDYCDFVSEALPLGAPDSRLERYLAAVCAEITASEPRPASSVYFGGGTPTRLGAERLLTILATLRGHGGILSDAEVTVEANPTLAEADGFARLRAGGVNRLSLGVQSFDDRRLRALGRTHDAAQAEHALRLARGAGFNNLSLDLMFALPGQTRAAWRATLERAVALAPEHLSLYSLTIEEGTPLAARVVAGAVRPVSNATDAAMFETAIATLTAAGWEHYEISNFARPGRRGAHNQVYWRNEEYRGYGPGAASYLARRRWTNLADLDGYGAAVQAGAPPVATAEERDEEGERRETMFLGLRLLAGVARQWYADRYGAPPEAFFGAELARLVARGVVAGEAGCWRLTPAGLLLANQVFMEFV